jgi:hypothetical protein
MPNWNQGHIANNRSPRFASMFAKYVLNKAKKLSVFFHPT